MLLLRPTTEGAENMIRGAASKVMWVGRATVFMVGLAVILALVFGVATSAMGANGKPFLLGRQNVASAISTLVKQGPGPALSLKVRAGQPPMAVNSSARVTNLNAATAGRADSAARADSATNAQNAADADKLDGKDSTEFAPSAAEPWHEVGATNEPQFQNGWTNLGDGRTATAAFYKDPWGTVHLKGTVKNGDSSAASTIFTLPCGYGPNKDQNFAVASPSTTNSLGILDVVFVSCGDGSYRAQVNAAQRNVTAFSLNGVSFTAHGS